LRFGKVWRMSSMRIRASTIILVIRRRQWGCRKA
jgi:hypothetical protein